MKDTGCLRVIPGSHRPGHWIRTQQIGLMNIVIDKDDIRVFLTNTHIGGKARPRLIAPDIVREAVCRPVA